MVGVTAGEVTILDDTVMLAAGCAVLILGSLVVAHRKVEL